MALTADWFTHHRERMTHWHRDRLEEVLADIAVMQQEIEQLQHEQAGQPASVTVTATLEGQTMSSFAPGATITFTAASTNKEDITVTDTYTWTTTAGTIVPGTDDTTVTISDAPLGDFTVTATDPASLTGSTTVTVADQTPTTVTVTAS